MGHIPLPDWWRVSSYPDVTREQLVSTIDMPNSQWFVEDTKEGSPPVFAAVLGSWILQDIVQSTKSIIVEHENQGQNNVTKTLSSSLFSHFSGPLTVPDFGFTPSDDTAQALEDERWSVTAPGVWKVENQRESNGWEHHNYWWLLSE